MIAEEKSYVIAQRYGLTSAASELGEEGEGRWRGGTGAGDLFQSLCRAMYV